MDMGTEYRSIILCEDEKQLDIALASREAKQVRDRQECRGTEEHGVTCHAQTRVGNE